MEQLGNDRLRDLVKGLSRRGRLGGSSNGIVLAEPPREKRGIFNLERQRRVRLLARQFRERRVIDHLEIAKQLAAGDTGMVACGLCGSDFDLASLVQRVWLESRYVDGQHICCDCVRRCIERGVMEERVYGQD